MFDSGRRADLMDFARAMFRAEAPHVPIQIGSRSAFETDGSASRAHGDLARQLRLHHEFDRADSLDAEADEFACAIASAQRWGWRRFRQVAAVLLAVFTSASVVLRLTGWTPPHRPIVVGLLGAFVIIGIIFTDSRASAHSRQLAAPARELSFLAHQAEVAYVTSRHKARRELERLTNAAIQRMRESWSFPPQTTPADDDLRPDVLSPPGQLVAASPHLTTGPPAGYHRDALMGPGGVLAA